MPVAAGANRHKFSKMRFSTVAAPWLLLLLASGNVHAQLRGDSIQRDSQLESLEKNDDTGTVANDSVVALYDATIDDVVAFDQVVDCNTNRLDSDPLFNSLTPTSVKVRNLAEDHHMFEPLNCNTGCNSNVETWPTWKQQNFNLNQKVTIPCGACIMMDYDASDVLELKGLNIEGTLLFPNGYKITIKTPYVHVQGELQLFARRRVIDEPNIKFLFTGTNELVTSFIPADNNRFACSSHGDTNPSPCFVGKKPFVVAGGKVSLNGFPQGCRTWTNLHDILRGELPTPTRFTKLPTPDPNHPVPTCRSLDPFMDEDFSTNSNVHGWTGGYGALSEVTPSGTFLVSDRKDSLDHGPLFDVRRIRDCLIPGQKYLFRARVKLTKTGVQDGTPTTCALTDNNCLWLQSIVRTTSGQIGNRMGPWEEKDYAWEYGRWQDFYATVTYTEEELSADNIYQILQLRGPEPEVDIEMDDVLFSLPPREAVPDPSNVCGGNIVLNGDAELDAVQPFPIENFGGVLTVEEEGSGNKYFHHYARSEDNHSIRHVFDAPDCFVVNGKYEISVRIRFNSNSPIASHIELRSEFADGSGTQYTIAECPVAADSSWTLCESSFTFPEELAGDDLREVRLQLETQGAPNVDMDVDDLKLEPLGGSTSSIIVPDDNIRGCWGTGAEVLITSHTVNYDGGQVRKLVSEPTPYGNGLVKLELDAAIIPATTRVQSEDFAVEVALLNRNILFEGDTDDPDSLIGAHFMVMHTPDVNQVIDGVEFRNFGQQGTLGRYPLHFHMCGSVDGALVTRNSIRNSNQRCIVVHGTHDLTITENVAYNTFGHCFMTEDGGEIDNVFAGNLGASTHAVLGNRVLGPLDSDDMPSTFWCNNPQNEWIGNVAAGSKGNGYWFELQTSVRGPTASMPLSEGMNPRFMNLKGFRDNVAHSNGQHGLRTYPQGFLPPDQAVFYNTRSFRNDQDGIFVHNSRNLAFQGSLLADNRIQFDFDQGGENILLQNASLIGVSDQYKYVLSTQPEVSAHSSTTGIELHGFTLDNVNDGASIHDVQFSGFDDTMTLVEIDPDVSHGHFDYWSTFRDVSVDGDVTPAQFDFSGAISNGIDDIFLTDVGSGLRPQGTPAAVVSTIISNTPAMTHFLDTSKCEEFADRGYMYCSDTCLRSVLLSVPSSMTDDFVLRINSEGENQNDLLIKGKFHNETMTNSDGSIAPDEVANSWIRKYRTFSAALPANSNKYVFRLVRGGQTDWPTSVEVTYEKPQCPSDDFRDSWLNLVIPTPDPSTCTELIKNGNMEMSSNKHHHWLHHQSGMTLAQGQGISGSTALFETDHRASNQGLLGQYLDTRCLEKGKQYAVQAWVKVTLADGTPLACDNIDTCPNARLKVRTPVDEDGREFSEFNMDVVSYFERPYRPDGFNLLRGTFTVDSTIESGASVLFFIERRRTGIKMLVDNVSVSLVDSDQCDELVFNGDFADGDSRFWYSSYPPTTMTIANGNSLKMTDRNSLLHTPETDVRTGCMQSGERYIAKARVRLENGNGSLFVCDPTVTSGITVCPRMRLRSFLETGDSGIHDGGSIAVTDHGIVNGWYTLSGVFTANDFDDGAIKSTLSFDRVSGQTTFLIDNVSIAPLEKNCNNLLLNGDAEYGDTPSFWTHWAVNANGGEEITLVQESANNHVFRVSNRKTPADGIHQFVDPRCLVAGQGMKLVARMKLVLKGTDQGVSCDPADTRVNFGCPPVRIRPWGQDDRAFYMSNRPNWSANGFNRYEVEITVDNVIANSDRVSVGIRGYNDEWDMLIDDVRLEPLV